MFYELFSLFLAILTGLVAGLYLLRNYMEWQKISFGNEFGRFILRFTNPILRLLRRVFPALGAWDTATLLTAFSLELLHYGLLWYWKGADSDAILQLPLLALFGVIRLILIAIACTLLAYLITTWFVPRSPFHWVMCRLSEPLLSPIRKQLPRLGGIDWSLFVVFIALNLSGSLLTYIKSAVL